VKEKSTSTHFNRLRSFRTGHRERLRARFNTGGIEAVQPHELLELILFRSLPRRDVKDLAHELIHDFGDLSAVLSAAPSELRAYSGSGAEHWSVENQTAAGAAKLGRAFELLPRPHG
jgi:DNA repair protein RadC